MRILINTVCFYPNIGGLETINMLLAEELANKGQEIVVLAPDYPNMEYDDSHFPFKVIRNVTKKEMFCQYMKCDVFLHSQISLKALWPILLWPFKKWYCSHHSCEFYDGKGISINAILKYIASRFPRNIAVSNAAARHHNLPRVTVIHNAYNDKLFKNQGKEDRAGFIYVGRLVSQKGINILLEAFRAFRDRNPNNIHTKLNIVGDGAERANIEAYINKHNLQSFVKLSGAMTGQALVDEMNKCYSQIVPSTYNEAFGIVALEAMATGCIPIVSDGDGLVEAVGDERFTFKKGNRDSLVNKMEEMINLKPSEITGIQKYMKDWCPKFSPSVVAQKYLDCLSR